MVRRKKQSKGVSALQSAQKYSLVANSVKSDIVIEPRLANETILQRKMPSTGKMPSYSSMPDIAYFDKSM
jgi:hypothetical protein